LLIGQPRQTQPLRVLEQNYTTKLGSVSVDWRNKNGQIV
jgi:hypothetical protein